MPDRMFMRPLTGPKPNKMSSFRFKMPRMRKKTRGLQRFLKSRVGK